jgi:hypothetical protein
MPTHRASCNTRANFETVEQRDLPNGRKGKHHTMLARVVDDLQQLADGHAIRMPLMEYPDFTVADLRSAIHRATAKLGLTVATSSDDEYLYVWKPADNTPA